jgi:hypothetical protein
MNSRQPIHMTHYQQTNNQFNDRRSVHTSSTKMVFNGPIHGYIEHVTGEGPVIAYSEVTYVERGYKGFSKTNMVPEQTTSSFHCKHYHHHDYQLRLIEDMSASAASCLPIRNTSEIDRREGASLGQLSPSLRCFQMLNCWWTDASTLISPSIPLPIERSVLESEFQQVSPEMQRYIKYLLHQYEKSYTESQKMAGETDQR